MVNGKLDLLINPFPLPGGIIPVVGEVVGLLNTCFVAVAATQEKIGCSNNRDITDNNNSQDKVYLCSLCRYIWYALYPK